jgi:hypothetical protein
MLLVALPRVTICLQSPGAMIHTVFTHQIFHRMQEDEPKTPFVDRFSHTRSIDIYIECICVRHAPGLKAPLDRLQP